MKRIVVSAVLLLACAQSAWAIDIKGKWGIGAGLFNGRGEISLIRGHSERTACLLDLSVSQRDLAINTEFTAPIILPYSLPGESRLSVAVGPGVRRYLSSADEFSPYWGVFLHGLYSRARTEGYKQEEYGAEAGLNFGLEYFTRWHFSVAAHSGLASVSWSHVDIRQSVFAVSDIHSTGHDQSASLGLSPALFLRAYF